MKNATILLFIIAGLGLLLPSCKKCYECHNICTVCTEQHQDTTLTATICSDVFGEKYYNEYIDSLTSPSLGWHCQSANSTYHEEFCGNKSNNAVDLINKKDAGLICAPK
jgi:hypothetical protein